MAIIICIVVLGLLFDYTNGFHDAANVVSTVVATRVLTPLKAIIMAGVLNFIGATQIGGVAHTIASGLIEAEQASQLVVLGAIVGAIFWNFLTWYYGIPSSSSYALIGGLIGAALVHKGAQTVIWSGLLFKVLIPMLLSPLIGFGLSFLSMKLLQWTLRKDTQAHKRWIFKHLQIGSAGFVALAHGFNDAQKSMGLITLGLFTGGVLAAPVTPLWVILSCALVMGLGTASGGARIIRTMGFQITKINPMQGFAAESSASLVILTAGVLGMPISSTHMIAGSITGVGAARGLRFVRWTIFQKLIAAWVLTLPGAALVGALTYLVLRQIM